MTDKKKPVTIKAAFLTLTKPVITFCEKKLLHLVIGLVGGSLMALFITCVTLIPSVNHLKADTKSNNLIAVKALKKSDSVATTKLDIQEFKSFADSTNKQLIILVEMEKMVFYSHYGISFETFKKQSQNNSE